MMNRHGPDPDSKQINLLVIRKTFQRFIKTAWFTHECAPGLIHYCLVVLYIVMITVVNFTHQKELFVKGECRLFSGTLDKSSAVPVRLICLAAEQ